MITLPWLHPQRATVLARLLAERVLVLDGAMGTMIQQHALSEADYRGERFAAGFDSARAAAHAHGPDCGCAHDQRGNNDLLSLTRPGIIAGIHREYLEAGADLVELAREVCDQVERATGQPRFVVGVLGPTNRTASLSPDVNRPGYRAVTFDELRDAYRDAADGLIDGGADVLMVETIFDTLNAKAALFAIEEAFDARGARLPVMISGTITDASGRTLSGQTAEAFWYSVRHAHPLAIGLNCALGAKDLRAHVDVLAQVADAYVSAHPNAGLPNAFGGYDETPEDMAAVIGEFAHAGLVNLVGGCCGTTPAHIRAIAEAVRGLAPRALPALQSAA